MSRIGHLLRKERKERKERKIREEINNIIDLNVQVIGRQGMLLQRRKRKSVAVATKASAGKAHPSSQ